MKKLYSYLLVLLVTAHCCYSQSTGDFRAVNAGGNWNVNATWQTWNGSAWVAASSLPTSSNNVSTGNADNIAVTIPTGYNAYCASLDIGGASHKNDDLILSGTGTLTVSGNLNFHRPNAGATNNVNIGTGTVTVGGNFTFVEAYTNNNRFSLVTITTGTLTIGSDLILNAPAAATTAGNEIDMSGGAGTLNLGGAFTITASGGGSLLPGTTSIFNYDGSSAAQTVQMGVTNFTYANLYLNNTASGGASLNGAVTATTVTGDIKVQSGTFSNGGNAIAMATSKTFQVANNAIFKMTGTTGMVTGTTITKTFSTNSTVDYDGTTQTISNESYYTLKTSGSGTKTLAATTTVAGNVIISSGTTLDASASNYNINVAGNWTNDGTFTPRSGTVTFNGGGSQAIGGSVTSTFNSLTLSNSVTVNTNSSVAATLTLSSGKMTIAPGVTVDITSGNAVSGSGFGASKHIVTQVNTSTGAKGYLRIGNFSSTMTFPIGNGTYYLPATVAPSATFDVSICAFQGATSNGQPNGTAFSAALKKNLVDAIWGVVKNSGSGNANVSVAWPAALEGTGFSAFANNEIGISMFDGSYWDDAIGTGDQSANTAIRSAVTTFYPLGVGKVGIPLPLKIGSVKATWKNNGVKVEWNVLTEINVDHYEVERSLNGYDYVKAADVAATGNSTSAINYSYTDVHVVPGNVFYRIKSVDIDGKYYYSTVVKLTLSDIGSIVSIYPNPVVNGSVAMEAGNLDKGNYTVHVYDFGGALIYTQNFSHTGGAITEVLTLPDGIKTGMYNLSLENNGTRVFSRPFAVRQ